MGGHQSAAMKSDVWLTPPHILAALPPFDLDPCAAPPPRPWATATRHIALPADGLAADWGDSFVWCNPPYSSEARHWLKKMSEHGNGVALVFARTETEWFWETVWESPTASAILFIEGRLHFHHADGTRARANAGAPSVLVAYGEHGKTALENRSGLAGRLLPVRRGS